MLIRHAAEWIFAVTICGTILISPIESGAAEDPTVEMARARFREGVQFYDKQQYEKARLAFLQAYALKPHPSVLLNLAQSELRGGRPADAATHFSEFLKTSSAGGAEKQDAEAGLAAAKAKVGEITVSSDTSGAQITVDGESRGVTPLATPVFVTPGRHVVEVRAGERKVSKPVTLAAGQSTSLDLSLAGTAGAAAAASRPVPETKAAAEKEATPPSEESQEAEPAKEPVSAPVEQQEAATPRGHDFFSWFADTPLAWVGAGIGIAGVGAGVTMAVLSSRKYSSADDLAHMISDKWSTDSVPYLTSVSNQDPALLPPDLIQGSAPCAMKTAVRNTLTAPPPNHATTAQYDDACSHYVDDRNTGNKDKTLAIVFGSVGVAALAGTVVYYFLDTAGNSETTAAAPRVQARVVPLLGPEVSGVGFVGRF